MVRKKYLPFFGRSYKEKTEFQMAQLVKVWEYPEKDRQGITSQVMIDITTNMFSNCGIKLKSPH